MIQVTPLGGLGEIGSNMMLFDDGVSGFIIDCGILFPDEELFEINYLIPAFKHLDPTYFKHMFITHGHEDHIGAVVHVVKWNPAIKIICSPLAKYMIRKKLGELQLSATFEVVMNFQELEVDQWKLMPALVNHSIPETYGWVVSHKLLNVAFFYASDFKVNKSTCDGDLINFKKIKSYMQSFATRVGMLDSTNILNSGKTTEEGELIPAFEQILAIKGRVLMTLFASNYSRLVSICNIAKKCNRRILVLGRSFWGGLQACIDHQLLDATIDDFLSADKYDAWKDQVDLDQLLVLVAGCQGDFFSSLRRVAFGEDPVVKLREGDRFVFSSKVIPGNEDKISRIYNKISETGAEIITASDMLIHCSGHPGQQDLAMVIDQLDFTDYVPVHGEMYFLVKHKKFMEQKYPQIRVHGLINKMSLCAVLPKNASNAKIPQKIDFDVKPYEAWQDPLLIHGQYMEIERTQIAQRRKIAANGMAFFSCAVTPGKRNVAVLDFLGLPLIMEEKKESIRAAVFEYMQSEIKSHGLETDLIKLKEVVRIFLRKVLAQHLGYKPICMVQIS